MKEKFENTIKIVGVTAEAMENILEFLYTNNINLGEENIRETLEAAHLMQISRKYKSCVSKTTLKQIFLLSIAFNDRR